MALVFKDRVKVSSTTAGTGTFTLGSAATGFQDFSVIGNGNTTYYTITDSSGNWEVGVGTYTSSGTTLSRDTILESSNSGSVVDFPSGSKTVFVTYPAEKSVYLDASGNVNLSGVLNPSGGIANGAVFNKIGAGGEGGELKLEKGSTSTLSGGVVIDSYNQSIRIFEDGGTNRGAQLDISAQASGVGSTILTTANVVAIANGGTGQTSFPASGLVVSTGSAWGTSKTAPSGDIVGTTDTQTISGKTITGTKETVYTITDGAAFEIDPANGGIQTITLTASRTPAATNFTAGQSVTLMINDGSAYTITWTTVNPTWVGGSAPTLATSGYTVIEFWKVGSTIYGAYVGTVA